MNKIEELKATAANEALSAEEREVAAKLLEKLGSSPKERIRRNLETAFKEIEEKAAAYRADLVARFKVCGSCFLKQLKANEACELCGASDKWESPITENTERQHRIAETTDYTDEQLNHLISAYSDVTRAEHCAKVLELRGTPRVRSFWERAGFDLRGRPIKSDAPKPVTLPIWSGLNLPPAPGVEWNRY